MGLGESQSERATRFDRDTAANAIDADVLILAQIGRPDEVDAVRGGEADASTTAEHLAIQARGDPDGHRIPARMLQDVQRWNEGVLRDQSGQARSASCPRRLPPPETTTQFLREMSDDLLHGRMDHAVGGPGMEQLNVTPDCIRQAIEVVAPKRLGGLERQTADLRDEVPGPGVGE